jgi:DNA-directed RNA polymerase subunit M/transcription elongation factor TFIIS
MRFCQLCNYYLYLTVAEGNSGMNLLCKNCGYSEKLEPKNAQEALILETQFRSGSSASGASSGITVNQYTKHDPTLPHIKSLRCPNGGCESNTGAKERDVIYIKTDPVNMKFQYVCTVCNEEWVL